MRVFVTGASGYIGQATARAFISAGHAVTGLARSRESADTVRKLGARVVEADLGDLATLRTLAREHEATVHAAGLSGPGRAEADRAAIFAMIEGAAAARSPRAVVYTSGCWTLGATGEAPADELRPATNPAEVSVYRVALEKDVLAAATDDVATSVVRPAMVYGAAPGQGAIAWFVEWVPEPAGKKNELVMVGAGENRWSVVHADDLGGLYVALAEQRARGVFHAAERNPVTVRELGAAVAKASGVPGPVAWPLADARAKLGPLADALALDCVLASPRSEAVLGWRPKHAPLLENIAAAWNEYARAAGEGPRRM